MQKCEVYSLPHKAHTADCLDWLFSWPHLWPTLVIRTTHKCAVIGAMSMPHPTKKNATCLGDLSSSPSALEQFSETCDSLTAQHTMPHPSKPPSQLFHGVTSHMHKSQVQPGQLGSADHWSIASNIGSPDSVRAGGRAV